MIIYFSATGNSKYVAKRIATALGETAYSIEKLGSKISLRKGEIFGVITPTYSWELPTIVRDYLKKLELNASGDRYSFVLATYGTTPGAAGAEAARLLRKKGLKVTVKYSIRMPDTWTPMFDLSHVDKVKERNAKAEFQLLQVISSIQSRKSGNKMHRAVPYPVRYLSDPAYNAMRKTKHFSVKDSCIGCGLCAKQCPVQAISIETGRPSWTKESCVMCLRCLHHCPRFAIQYGTRTQAHGQYTHPKVKV